MSETNPASEGVVHPTDEADIHEICTAIIPEMAKAIEAITGIQPTITYDPNNPILYTVAAQVRTIDELKAIVNVFTYGACLWTGLIDWEYHAVKFACDVFPYIADLKTELRYKVCLLKGQADILAANR